MAVGSRRPEPLRPRLGGIALLLALAQLAKRVGFGAQVAHFGLRRMFSESRKRKAFAGYAPDEHDVFVATFAKSGTNWMMQIAQQIAWRGEAEFEHIHHLVPWPDAPGPSPLPLSDRSVRDRCPTGLRLIKTHLEPAFVPYSERAVYLTVIRDPKEVLVSSYYFLGGMLGVLSHVSIDEWLEIFLRPGQLAAAWAAHTAGFWAWRDRPNVLVLTYPEIQAAPREAIVRVARRMGVRLDETQLARVACRSSFAWMHANEARFAPPRLPFMRESERPRMVRRGAAGGSDEALSPEQQAAVDALCRAELRRLGSEFPYATAFRPAASAGP